MGRQRYDLNLRCIIKGFNRCKIKKTRPHNLTASCTGAHGTGTSSDVVLGLMHDLIIHFMKGAVDELALHLDLLRWEHCSFEASVSAFYWVLELPLFWIYCSTILHLEPIGIADYFLPTIAKSGAALLRTCGVVADAEVVGVARDISTKARVSALLLHVRRLWLVESLLIDLRYRIVSK